jgi:hypothetical protein
LIIGIVCISGCVRRGESQSTVPTQSPSHAPTIQTSTSSASTNQIGTEKPTITHTQETTLSRVKVATLYERVTDGIAFSRSMDDVVAIFKETNTDLIFRGFFRWEPVPESSDVTMPGYPNNYVTEKTNIGYSYKQLGDSINKIKTAKPNTIFVGAIAAQRLNKVEFNDITHESFTQPQTWAMALDPTTLNLGSNFGTKEDAQCKAAKGLGWIGGSVSCPSGYNTETSPAYFPDITNEQYQRLLLSWAEKQIDLGADAIWIDMLFAQASFITEQTRNPNHPAAKAAYVASSKIVNDIHAYGTTKYNKHIYVGTWSTFIEFPYTPPDVDFVSVSIPSQEIISGLNDGSWNTIKEKIIGKIGNKPILVFIDWSGSASAPMGVFSQTLTPAQQKTFLMNADDLFTKKGMTFIYPVHGGTFPISSTKLSFGKYNVYDSLAPEFGTYGTIKDLALKKAGV